VNIAAYKFVTLDDLESRRIKLRAECRKAELKGTILLTPEGINLFVAGARAGVDRLINYLRADEHFSDLKTKESFSDEQPFERMLIKIKEEIIAFGVDGVDPRNYTSKKIAATKLKEWLDAGDDVILLDTRNDYEVNVGTFDNALPIGVNHFRDFPEAVEDLPDEMRDKPVVMFCTGGIRCEKAGPFMEAVGFRDVYQLDGGILKYFEDCGGDHYHGECFVFDKRVALNPDLKETETAVCYGCLAPVSVEDQSSPHYDPPHSCPQCYVDPVQRAEMRKAKLQAQLIEITNPLPGSVPYDNVRPLNVPQKFDQCTLLDFLLGVNPRHGEEFWLDIINDGRIVRDSKPLAADRIVRAGYQIAHLEPATVEPDVNANIELLYEDEALVVVNKPAPLPMHPSGRFNRNSLEWILNEVFHPRKLRPAHRLDANTTGVSVFCQSRTISRKVQPQFTDGTVKKVYLARVNGTVDWEKSSCDAPISREPVQRGGRTIDHADGLPAETRFEKEHEFIDGTTLLRVIPLSGRTNQIRVHLWHLGIPVVGDPLYFPNGEIGSTDKVNETQTMCLHALKLSLVHPLTSMPVTFEAPRPKWADADTLLDAQS